MVLLNFRKHLRSVEKVVVLASEVALPSIRAPYSRVVRSSWFGVWIVELEVSVFQRRIPAAI